MAVWLLTWTTYGTWLPGDERGSVTSVREEGKRHRVRHNNVGTPYDGGAPGLARSARELMKGPPVKLTRDQAEVALAQLVATIEYRRWRLLAAAMMYNHAHVVVEADAPAEAVLRDLKAYASRALNERFGPRESGRWWTQSGSKRSLPNDDAVEAAILYVQRQHQPLAMFAHDSGKSAGKSAENSAG